MRQKNWRFISVGLALPVIAGMFFLYMLSFASKSNDPAGLMSTVGEAAGVVAGIGLVLIVLGLMGKKF